MLWGLYGLSALGKKLGLVKNCTTVHLKNDTGPKPEKGQKKINKSNHAIDEYV